MTVADLIGNSVYIPDEGMRWQCLDGVRLNKKGGFTHERRAASVKNGASKRWTPEPDRSLGQTDAIVLFAVEPVPEWAKGWVEWRSSEYCEGVRVLVAAMSRKEGDVKA